MSTVFEQLQNPLMRQAQANDRSELRLVFSDLPSEGRYLSLRAYLHDRPQKFFDRRAYSLVLDWLRNQDANHRAPLQQYLQQHELELGRALLFLREVNSASWHDELITGKDDWEVNRFIDTTIHPVYLRLVEAVFFPLTRVIAHFKRIETNRSTEGLNLWSAIQELASPQADLLLSAYRHLMRNAIAHGGITYLQNEIRYRDKNGQEDTLGTTEVVRTCDDLLDICNGLAAAYKVFWVIRHDVDYRLPREFMIEELAAETSAPWWRVEAAVESEIAGRPQLIVYTRLETRDYSKVQWSTIQSGIMAEYLAPGYSRYFFSLRSPSGLPGWAAFDGDKLRSLRESGENDLAQYAGVLESLFFLPRPKIPKFLGKVMTLVYSFRVNWPFAVQEMRDRLGTPNIVSRNATIHRNGWRSVLNGQVVLEGMDEIRAQHVIRNHRRRIVRKALKFARDAAGRGSLARYLPLGYARIAVVRRDYRRRRLNSFGLPSDLVCTVQVKRIRRIQAPDIIGATIETSGKWRIAWNRSWLEAQEQQA